MRIILTILGCLWLNTEAIKVGVKLETPFVMEKAEGGYEGFIVDLVNKLGELTGENVTLVVSEQTIYGGFDDNGNITGLLGELEDGEYDMAAGPITITQERQKFVDFSDGFWSTGLTMLTKRPERKTSMAGKMFIYFRPFSAAVWVVIIICTIIASVLHYVMNKFHPKDAGLVNLAGEAVKKPSMYSEGRRVADACWWICRSFSLQGAESRPKSIAGRVVLVVWLMFVLDTLFLYLATLVNNIPLYYPTPAQQAAQAAMPLPLPFTSIDNIYEQDHCQFGTLSNSAISSFFAVATSDTLVNVNQAMENVASIDEGLEQVRNGRYVMFMDDVLAQYYANTDCDMITVGGSYENTVYSYGFAFPMGSQLKNTVNGFNVINPLMETAKTSHNIWWNANTLECKPYVHPVNPPKIQMPYKIAMDSFGGPVILFIIGQLIALLVAVIEVVVIKRRTRSYDVEGAKDAESTPMLEAEESQAVKYEEEGKDKDEEAKDSEDVKEGDDDSVKKEKEAANAEEEEKKDDDKEIKEGDDEKEKSDTEAELKDNKDIVGADDVNDKVEEKEEETKSD